MHSLKNNQKLIQVALIGTTASGKTKLAIELAKQNNGIILSLDSLAIYKQINIASAKPSPIEQNGVLHFGIDMVDVDQNFNVGDFFKVYKAAAEFAKNEKKVLFITGGSGFYLRSLLKGLTPPIPQVHTNDIPDLSYIYKKAKQIDPKWADKFSKNDTYRLIRWWEIFIHTNSIPSNFLEDNTQPPIIKNIDIFEILWDRDELIKRIHERTKKMIEDGLLNEAENLFNNYDHKLKPLQSIGLKECKEYFDKKIKDINKLQELIAIHTSQLAKRQRTFNKSQFEKKFTGDIKSTQNKLQEWLKNPDNTY